MSLHQAAFMSTDQVSENYSKGIFFFFCDQTQGFMDCRKVL